MSIALPRGRFGEGQAGEMRLAVDKDGANAAGALTAAIFRCEKSPTSRRSVSSRFCPPSTNTALSLPFRRNSHRRLAHAVSPSSRRFKCTGRTSRRYQADAIASSAGDVPSAATARAGAMLVGIEGFAIECALDRKGAYRCWRHAVIGDSCRSIRPAVNCRNAQDRHAFRFDAGRL